MIAPKQVVANLAAGAIAESAAQNAGDLMQVRIRTRDAFTAW